jgi:hypothetical protein
LIGTSLRLGTLLRDCRVRDSQIGMIGGLGMPTTHRARIKYHQYQLR